jgi:hypothetical protein
MSIERVRALVDEFWGPPDEVADRAVHVLNAHAAALAWVRDTTGSYPAPAPVAARLNAVADQLRHGKDDRDPGSAMILAAVSALAEMKSRAA